MTNYETEPIPTAVAEEFARLAEELVGTEVEIDYFFDGMASVTVFELESYEEVEALRELEINLCL